MKRPLVVEAAVLVALITLALPAAAEPQDPATARALFDDATKALDQGNWDGACPKFDASFALKPTVSALLNIAKCHEHAGKLTLAADDYHRALSLNEDTVSQTRKKELAAFADEALHKLEARTPRLRISVNGAPAGLRVTRDGEALPVTALGMPIPVDPGEHVVVAAAPGRKTDTQHATLVEGKEATVSFDLAPDDATPPPVAPTAPAVAPTAPTVAPKAPAATPPSSPVTPESRRGIPVWAWIGGAAGIAFAGGALAFAVDGAGANCGGPCTDNRFFQSDLDALNARRHRDLGGGLALGGVGAVGLALGVIGIGFQGRF